MPAFRSIAAIAALSLLPQIFAQDTTVVDPSIDNSTSSDTTVSSSQYWHERYHGLLSMAAYDPDFETKCMEQTFNQAALMKSFPDSTEAPWTLIERFGPTESGVEGFNVIIPEMDKIVTVFKGMFGWESTFNDSSADIGEALFIGERCSNATGGPCLAHAGALQAYLEVKELTNSFALAESYVTATGHQWSVTGHGFGGMLAQIASLDLGWRNKLHWSHSHGSPRVFNPAAAQLYNQLFQGEAGQRTVANEDAVVEYIPESANYTHVLQGFHIYGENATYGMNFDVCNEVNDPNCLGGNNVTDHLFYYTPIGECGSPNKANYTQQDIYESTASEAFYATATSTFVAPTSTPEPTSTSMDSSMSQAMASSASAAAASGNPGGQNAASNTNGASTLKTGLAGLVVTAFGFVLLA